MTDPRADLEHLPDLNVFDIARNESAVPRELAIRILVERGRLYVSREEIAGEARQLVLDPSCCAEAHRSGERRSRLKASRSHRCHQ